MQIVPEFCKGFDTLITNFIWKSKGQLEQDAQEEKAGEGKGKEENYLP